MMPKRVQRRRVKGWRMPENCVYVGRPTKWGNPYNLKDGFEGEKITRKDAVELFRGYASARIGIDGEWINELKGKNLCCFCPLDQPCHADVLLEIANSEDSNRVEL